MLTSDGLFGTGRRSEPLARLAPWSSPGRVWAPSVLVRPGGFVMYYSTRAPDPDRQCLSRAVGSNPKGPFVDNSAAPLVCPKGGAIDASPFVDADGRAVLIWKHAAPGMTGIVAQQLTPDGLGLVGPRRLLLRADQPWEGGNVEGPSMVAHAGRYYLFYSGNDFATANYAIGYATCETPFGPCRKAPGPWLGSSADAKGPGGQEVFSDSAGRLWLALHAWIRGYVGYPGGARNLFVLPLTFVDGVHRRVGEGGGRVFPHHNGAGHDGRIEPAGDEREDAVDGGPRVDPSGVEGATTRVHRQEGQRRVCQVDGWAGASAVERGAVQCTAHAVVVTAGIHGDGEGADLARQGTFACLGAQPGRDREALGVMIGVDYS